MRTKLALLVALALSGCIHRLGDGAPAKVESFETGGAAFRLVYLDEDAATAKELESVLAEAVPRTRRWGELGVPVTVTIHPSHAALEAAVHRRGFQWLRAWARYSTIDLQSPRTWGVLAPARAQVVELVTHELTHCVMYQTAASDWSWSYKGIPLWFREGLASVTAEQGYRRPGVEPIWHYYQSSSPGSGGGDEGGEGGSGGPHGGDPLTDPEPLYQADSEIVYGTAHHAVEFLVARYGEERVRAVLANMQSGDFFATAFRRAIGITPEEFERDFRRYVLWEGWRGARAR